MRCEHLHDSAVYVLGALSPPEREAYERHLVDCAECRAEVAEFADLPGLLGRLDASAAAQLAAADDAEVPGGAAAEAPQWAGPTVAAEAPKWAGPTVAPNGVRWAGPTVAPDGGTDTKVDPLMTRVLDRAGKVRRTERKRRRWQTAGTALVAACLGVVAVFGIRAAGAGQPDFAAMREVAAQVPVTAKVAMDSEPDGTRLIMQCAYKAGGGDEYVKWTYKLFVVPKTGAAEEVSTWTAREGDELKLTSHSHIARKDIQRVEIRKGDGTPLLSLTA